MTEQRSHNTDNPRGSGWQGSGWQQQSGSSGWRGSGWQGSGWQQQADASRPKRFSMGKVGNEVSRAIESMGASSADAAKQMRASQVKAMWRDLMESNGDEAILDHTNAVYIIKRTVEDYESTRGNLPHTSPSGIDDKKDASATGIGKQLIVYVDDSMVASELNARRELIKMQFAARYREELDEFKIFISRGQYKNNHPFKSRPAPSYEAKVESVPLTPEELAWVDERVQVLENERLREVFRSTMIADMEWKRGVAKAEGKAAVDAAKPEH